MRPSALNETPDDVRDVDLVAVARLAQAYMEARGTGSVTPTLTADEIARRVSRYDFAAPCDVTAMAADVLSLLAEGSVRSDSPRYFGLFNPPARPAGVAGDLIAAACNPQLAVWSHSPAAAEIEASVVRLFCGLVGWAPEAHAGTFTTGGGEANHTAVLAALARRYPNWAQEGLAALDARPAIFCSQEAHLAWIKIARSVGLGAGAVQLVPAPDGLALTAEAVRDAISARPDLDPVLIVATAGATAHGAIDDLPALGRLAGEFGAHFHVDAAWAGSALLLPELAALFDGISQADSVTIDPHKMLAAPMGAGLFLAQSWEPLAAAFSVSTGYMPPAFEHHPDAYLHSMQWSRRFIGLKVFMDLAASGLEGVRRMIRRQVEVGQILRAGLEADGWRVLNDTPLPLVVFDEAHGVPGSAQRVAGEVAASGAAWISAVKFRGAWALRACVTSYESTTGDVETLLKALRVAR